MAPEPVVDRFAAAALPENWSRFVSGIGPAWAPSRQALYLLVIAGEPPALNVLDVGCGPAVFFRTLCRHQGRGLDRTLYYGCDTSPAMLVRALETHPELEGSLFEMPSPTSIPHAPLGGHGYETAILRHVLEHVDDPGEVLRQVLRSTRRRVGVVFSVSPATRTECVAVLHPSTPGERMFSDEEMGIRRWFVDEDLLLRVIEEEGFARSRHQVRHTREMLWVLNRKGAS